MAERIFARQFHAAEGAEAWRILPEGAGAFFRTDSFATAVRFLNAIAEHVPADDPPQVDIRRDGVTVLLRAFRPAGYGLYEPDLDLARAISVAARELGLDPDPAAVQGLSVIPGNTDRSAILPFWQAVLRYVPRPDSPDEDLVDPHDRLAPFWFEAMDELRPDGKGSIHLVVWVPWDQAESRVAAALAAGGRLVRHNTEELFDPRRSRRQRGRHRDRPAARSDLAAPSRGRDPAVSTPLDGGLHTGRSPNGERRGRANPTAG